MAEMIIRKYDCPRCGAKYEDAERAHFQGKPCGNCSKLTMNVNVLITKLLREISSLDAGDEAIAKEMHAVLSKEYEGVGLTEGNEHILNHLLTRLMADEQRRRKVLKEIRKLQKKKR